MLLQCSDCRLSGLGVNLSHGWRHTQHTQFVKQMYEYQEEAFGLYDQLLNFTPPFHSTEQLSIFSERHLGNQGSTQGYS